MFDLKQCSTPRHPEAWRLKKEPCWLIWEWKAGHWNISLDAYAPVSPEELITAVEKDDRYSISRHRFHSRREALRFLKGCLA